MAAPLPIPATDSVVGLRHAPWSRVHSELDARSRRCLDVVTTAGVLQSRRGDLDVFSGRVINSSGRASTADGRFTPIRAADDQLAALLNIPPSYLHQLRAGQLLDVYDANVNGHLHHDSAAFDPLMLRCDRRPARSGRGPSGSVRAILPAARGTADTLDVFQAVATGVEEAGVEVRADTSDLTETSVRLYLHAAAATMIAPDLLHGYTRPGSDTVTYRYDPSGGPTYRVPDHRSAYPRSNVVGAGMRVSYSDTGAHDLALTPELILTESGLRVALPAHTRIHRWISGGTTTPALEENLAAITALGRACAHWFTVPFLTETIKDLAGWAMAPVHSNDHVSATCHELGLTVSETACVAEQFAACGRSNHLDVVLAIASFARTITDDIERGWHLDDLAMRAVSA